MIETAVLLAAGFGAGVLNTLAGGGSFLTFPALIFAGLPPVVANATSAVAVFPGYLSGAAGFAPELRAQPRARLTESLVLGLAGGLAGALLLLISSNAAFSAIIPFLLLAATLLFALGPRLRAFAARHQATPTTTRAMLFATCLYGGYFNGGLGIVLLALYAVQGMTDLHAMNGLKALTSIAVAAISVATFALAGIVSWPEALIVGVANIAGGYLGAPLARALPAATLRVLVVTIGLVMSALFFARLF